MRSGRGRGGTSDGERLFLTCSQFAEVTQATLLDLRADEQLWQAEFESCPLLSPGGAHVAFVHDGRLVLQSANLGEAPIRTLDGAHEVHWSPSGHALLARGDTLQLLDVDAGRTLHISDQPSSASWALSSSHFLVAERCDEGAEPASRLRVFEYDGQLEERWVTQCSAWADPDLSPDGTAILAADGERIHWLDASGAQVVDLGHSPRWRPVPP